jgi:phage replication-related protein YjqB (UPF0714/DUF867 family)
MRILLILLVSKLAFAAGERDTYSDYAEMAAAHREGVDFFVDTADKGSPITVLAIHGGKIEPLSAEIARAIAGDKMNFYIFRAAKEKGNWSLHVTSTHFDDPRAVEMVEKSKYAISIHGYKANGEEVVCVGGGNEDLRDFIAQKLQQLVKTENPCAVFSGKGSTNIVNRAANQGVQLELSRPLRDRLAADQAFFKRFTDVLCEAMLNYPGKPN